MKKQTLILIVTIFSTFGLSQNSPPLVSNVAFAQRTDGSGIVDVYYDLSSDQANFIIMQASIDNGTTWTFSCEQVTGHVGPGIPSGTGKHIEWNFGLEYPNYYSPQFRIKVIAADTEGDILTDMDGNVYATVAIGSQVWMAENLRVSHYRNGDAIIKSDALWEITNEWGSIDSGAYCIYDNISNIYGHLYNWHAVNDSRNIAPAGWHIPSYAEWQALVDHLGGDDLAGVKLKDTGTMYWDEPNTGATNESGFTGLPGGLRQPYSNSQSMGGRAHFWSTTTHPTYTDKAWGLRLFNNAAYSNIFAFNKYDGYSVRCVKD